jgi:hypothetical protein
MITAEALDIVLDMARERCSKANQTVTTTEIEAIKEVEFLLSSYDDEDYDEDDYC